jgi:hypothetical protein
MKRYAFSECLAATLAQQAAQIAALQQQIERFQHGTLLGEHGRKQHDRITALEAQNRALREAGSRALTEMCNTVAPRQSFTDAVDALDAALATPGIAPATPTED